MNRVIQQSVDFDEAKHSYRHRETGEYHVSVTKFIKKFSHPFLRMEMAARVAKRDGREVQSVLREWEEKRDVSVVRGKAYHKAVEDFLKDGIWNDRYEKILTCFQEQLEEVVDGQILTEQILSLDHYGISGTTDNAILYWADDYFDVGDLKSNEKIDKVGFQGRRMLYPLNHLQDCHLSHYTLQLSIYAYMLEFLTGLKARTLTIYHVNHYDEIEVIVVPYLKKEVQAMLFCWENELHWRFV